LYLKQELGPDRSYQSSQLSLAGEMVIIHSVLSHNATRQIAKNMGC